VRIRPGKPIALARLPEYDAVAFALPGKPIAAHTAASFVLRPFFTGNGRLPTIEATLARDIEIDQDGFEYAVPVTLRDTENGAGSGPEAMPLGHVDSTLAVYEEHFDPSVLASSTRATRADGVFLTRSRVEAGGTVPVISYGVLE
jgi:molybdopterin molybdotransferase